MRRLLFALLSAGLLATPAAAHHGTGQYDFSRDVTLAGRVKAYSFGNPHIWLTLEADAAAGGAQEWSLEGPPPAYAAPQYRAPGGQTWRQGQRLPPMYRGDVVRDPGRYRLRAAPPGYDWVGVGPDIYLVQRSTGMVLDTVPGGY